MPRKYPYNTSSAALLTPAKDAFFFEDWDAVVDNENHDLLCAEMSRLAYADEVVVSAALARIGFSPVGFLGGDTLAARIAARGTQGFVATHPALGMTILAFRGTESGKFEDLASDLATLQTDYPGGGRIHTGFLKAYAPVRDRIEALLEMRAGSLLVTGHSLGAALATVAAASLRTAPAKLITFGSPRVGGAHFCAGVETRLAAGDIHRFVNCCDVVTRVPPERFDSAHFSTLFNELGDFDRLGPLAGRATKAVADIAARALADSFRRLGPIIEFAHVAPPRYIRFDGTVVDESNNAERVRDQQAARAAYPHSTSLRFAELETQFRALLKDAGGNAALRAFVRGLFDLVRGDPVPLRDLADHAPINYFSGVAGRAGPAP